MSSYHFPHMRRKTVVHRPALTQWRVYSVTPRFRLRLCWAYICPACGRKRSHHGPSTVSGSLAVGQNG
jgi:hypothetical protein